MEKKIETTKTKNVKRRHERNKKRTAYHAVIYSTRVPFFLLSAITCTGKLQGGEEEETLLVKNQQKKIRRRFPAGMARLYPLLEGFHASSSPFFYGDGPVVFLGLGFPLIL